MAPKEFKLDTHSGFSVILQIGTFVMCQYWSSRMFTKDVVGTANALVGGWGKCCSNVKVHWPALLAVTFLFIMQLIG